MLRCVSLPAILIAAPALAGPLPSATHAWSPAGLTTVVTAPARVTDIVLEPGEALTGSGPVAAGDTARWVIGHTESGTGPDRQVHVLVKPTAPGLATNLVINTDRRTYRVELRSTADTWTPAVSWRYPAGELIAVTGKVTPRPSQSRGPEPDIAALNFGWRIEGKAPFRPLRVFDDGRRTYVDFPKAIAADEMPPLFVLSDRSDAAEVVNVRVTGARMIVDRTFARGELRLGAGRKQARVRLERETPP